MKLNEILEGIKAKRVNSEDEYSLMFHLVELAVIQATFLEKNVVTVVIQRDPDSQVLRVNGGFVLYLEDKLEDIADRIREHLVSEGIDFGQIDFKYTENVCEIIVRYLT